MSSPLPAPPGASKRPINGLVGKALDSLRRDYFVVGQTRIRGWQAWLVIGLVTGIATGIVYVASVSRQPEQIAQIEFPTSEAATLSNKLVPSQGALFGTWAKPRSGRTMKAELLFLEEEIGRMFNISHTYYQWDDAIPNQYDKPVAAEGRIPLISWNPTTTTWTAIANGREDAKLEATADAFKAYGKSVMVVFHHEPEDEVGPKGTTADYQNAWRRVVKTFRDRGAENVVWVWTLMAWTFEQGGADQYYPGDAYVDWIAADGYNWHPGRTGAQWRSFKDVYAAFYAWGLPHGKPLMAAEWGVQEDAHASPHGYKAQWFRDAMQTLKTDYPKFKALVYFNSDKIYPWWFDSTQASLDAFRTMAQDPYFNPLAADSTPPSTPSGLVAEARDASVALAWTANSEPDLSNYGIQYKPSASTSWTLISGVDKALTTYTVTGLTNGTSYDFQIRARDTSDNISPWSAAVQATPTFADASSPTVSITSPLAQAVVAGMTAVAVAAQDDRGVTKVNLFVDGTFRESDASAPYAFSWDTAAVSDGSHTLAAKAFDAAGNEGLSPAVTVTVANPPRVPSGLTADPGSGKATLAWTANTEPDLSAYIVRSKPTSGTTWIYSGDLPKTSTTYAVTGLTNDTSYDFQVRAKDSAGNKSDFSATVSATPQGGLTGTYFDSINLTAQKLVRLDATVNFDWGTGSPNTAIDPDTFSVRWTGKVKSSKSGTYTFYAQSDDGVRLWVNGRLIIDKWIDQGVKEWSGTIKLTAGQLSDIKLEYYENGGQAVATLLWSGPSVTKQVIPKANLSPE